MEYEYRQQRQGDLAHPNRWIVTLEPEKDTGCVKEDGIEQDDDNERDAIAIQILSVGPVVTTRIEIAHHVAYVGVERLDGCWKCKYL